MFDNEMNWVTRLKCRQIRREAHRLAIVFKHVKYKAEHMRVSATY